MGRYTPMNAEFHRIARRDKKVFLNEQCKEIEESKRMGKTRDLFKKTEDIKGIFHVRMSMIKDRKSGPNRNRRDPEEVARIHRGVIQKRS